MMDRLAELNAALEELAVQERRCSKLDAAIADFMTQRRERQEQERRTALILEREEADVTRLEGMSLRGLLLSLTGDKEERLLRERREAAAARLAHDQAARDLLYIEGELSRAQQERDALGTMPHRRAALLEEKAAILIAQGGDGGRRLAELDEAITRARCQRAELEEAVSAGRAVVAALAAVQDSLGDAEDWGMWDMLGGGLLTTIIKHDHIDEAKSGLDEVQHALSRFRTELSDIDATYCPQIQIGDFATFADWFFDGILSDWYIQSGINEAQDGVDETCSRVQKVLEGLNAEHRALDSTLKKLEQERQTLLTK